MSEDRKIQFFKGIIDDYNALRHEVDEDIELDGYYDKEETQRNLEIWYHITGLILDTSYYVDKAIYDYIKTIE